MVILPIPFLHSKQQTPRKQMPEEVEEHMKKFSLQKNRL